MKGVGGGGGGGGGVKIHNTDFLIWRFSKAEFRHKAEKFRPWGILNGCLSQDSPEHPRLKERGVEKGSGRHSTLQSRERSVFNLTNTGTVSRAILGRLMREGRSPRQIVQISKVPPPPPPPPLSDPPVCLLVVVVKAVSPDPPLVTMAPG